MSKTHGVLVLLWSCVWSVFGCDALLCPLGAWLIHLSCWLPLHLRMIWLISRPAPAASHHFVIASDNLSAPGFDSLSSLPFLLLPLGHHVFPQLEASYWVLAWFTVVFTSRTWTVVHCLLCLSSWVTSWVLTGLGGPTSSSIILNRNLKWRFSVKIRKNYCLKPVLG